MFAIFEFLIIVVLIGVSNVEIESVPNLERLEYRCSLRSNLEVADCNNLKEFKFKIRHHDWARYSTLISKLPFLETLNLQISFCLRRLKRLSLFGSSCNLLEELVIDCPNLCLYKYRGFVSPLFSINTSCLHYVTITLMLHAIHTHTHSHTQWFLWLRKYLANFKQINCL